MTMLKLYKSSLLSCRTHIPNGKELHFVAGRYATDNEEEIAFLDAEIKAKNPTFYVDAAEREVDSVRVDPVEAIRKKAIADYLAEQAAKVGKDTGNTIETKNIGTTADALALVKSNLAK